MKKQIVGTLFTFFFLLLICTGAKYYERIPALKTFSVEYEMDRQEAYYGMDKGNVSVNEVLPQMHYDFVRSNRNIK